MVDVESGQRVSVTDLFLHFIFIDAKTHLGWLQWFKNSDKIAGLTPLIAPEHVFQGDNTLQCSSAGTIHDRKQRPAREVRERAVER